MRHRRSSFRLRRATPLLLIVLAGEPVLAGERYAMVVTGASGGEVYAQKYDGWRATLVSTLTDTFGYSADRLRIFAENEGDGVMKATRENVVRVLLDLRKRLSRDDQLLVVLIGHGTSLDGEDAKFNLVGPDLSASEWADLLKPMPGRVLFVNTTGASFPFLQKLAGRGRVVLTATDSAAQQFETIFPEYFVNAFVDAAADADKDGRVSLWEACAFASAGVRQWFEHKGQLPTERKNVRRAGIHSECAGGHLSWRPAEAACRTGSTNRGTEGPKALNAAGSVRRRTRAASGRTGARRPADQGEILITSDVAKCLVSDAVRYWAANAARCWEPVVAGCSGPVAAGCFGF
jgi:hypothetical protein